jgi:hypothetical protein
VVFDRRKANHLLQLISNPTAATSLPVAAKGEPDTGVSDSFGAMPYIPTAAVEPMLGKATPKNFPLGEIFIPSGLLGTGREPVSVSAPFGPMLKIEMLLDPPFPAYRKLPLGVTDNEIPRPSPDPPVPTGASMGAKTPVVRLI